jgi:hypothetical protein
MPLLARTERTAYALLSRARGERGGSDQLGHTAKVAGSTLRVELTVLNVFLTDVAATVHRQRKCGNVTCGIDVGR